MDLKNQFTKYEYKFCLPSSLSFYVSIFFFLIST